ncbi:MAG: isoleucine--tRNA ligase [Candidatus Methanomethylicota archaeon]|uniref:Isoleucine--tRNA ligase n=1 Tax=Thermoproteota archaeon TaxID=2056631 RepID=A0A497EUI9_9CREN|nr:MAG: isoleucine--tRNA ligase [Candidatus Verstraetearchaeota archaeon]
MAFIGLLPKDYEPQRFEEEILSWWEANKIREKVNQLRANGPKFYFLDGPPYVTNPIHVGTAWNKILKDAYLRFYRMKGYHVRDQPGFDMHGLPIEVMVEKKLGTSTKRDIEEVIGVERFVNECKSYALENLKIATNQFKSLGVWMDWDNPYMTITNDYIEAVWWMIKKADEKGLLMRGVRVVHWCPRCETVLAGYEVTDEYRLVKHPSIYVKFPLKNKDKEFIIIWTTTPWTLPANVAVMVHPDYEYARVKVGNEVYILAMERVPFLVSKLNVDYEILEVFKGRDLEGLKYEPPLKEEVPLQSELTNAHYVVLSDKYVRLTEGTGCVHSAPGHGEEDFEVGLEYGLPTPCPVDENGRFTEQAGKYAGLKVFEANPIIVEDLRRKGLLLFEEEAEHRYPHCWRCKTPLILRLADQWFIKVTDIKQRMMEENERVTWVPEWAGKSRFGNWIRDAKDWVISRQRYWGIPLPIWICELCGKYVVIGSLKELIERAVEKPKGDIDLHRPWVDQVKLRCSCGGIMRRVKDVVDVWMDSGAASWASLSYPKRAEDFQAWWPADLVLEGHDQTRGWFYTLMVCGVVAFDQAPYKRVLMHGFSLDQYGRAMHKSLGNVVYPEEVISKLGRDALRWYELKCTTWDDLKFTWKELEEAFRALNIIWNTYYFASLYMNLDKFNPKAISLKDLLDKLKPEDRWILSRLNKLIAKATTDFENLKVFEVAKDLMDFLVNDVSRWYIKLIRRRTWVEEDTVSKTIAYAVLSDVLFKSLIMMAPIAPFMAEKIYQDMFKCLEDMPESIHMMLWPEPDISLVDEKLEAEMGAVKELIETALSIRQKAGIKLRYPLTRVIVVSDDKLLKDAAEKLKHLILDQLNVKELDYLPLSEELKLKNVIIKPNYAVLGPKFKDKTPKVVELLTKLDMQEALSKLSTEGKIQLNLDGEVIELDRDCVKLEEMPLEGLAWESFSRGRVYLDTKLDEKLIAEGLARDIVRRIQEMRKEADLKVDAFIEACIVVPNEKALEHLEQHKSYISQETRAKVLNITLSRELSKGMKLVKEWDIGEELFIIGINYDVS